MVKPLRLTVNGGSPSVLFDAIVSIIMPEQAEKLAKVSEAIMVLKMRTPI